MTIRSWSTTASSNNSSPPNGWPEGMAPSGVNNSARQMMADIRDTFEQLGYFDFGDTPTRVDADTFTVATDLTARYAAGKQIKLVGATTEYGIISSSSYSAPNTTVEVTGTVPTSLSTVSIGITAQPEYRRTAAEIAAGITTINYNIPSHDACGQVIIERYGTNTTPGTTVMTTPINNALAVAAEANCEIMAKGVYLTDGGHTISTQNLIGTGRSSCSFKNSTATTGSIFNLTSTGSIRHLSLDGGGLNGDGLIVTTAAADYYSALVYDVDFKNFGGSISTLNITGVSRGATTTLTVSANPSTINVAAGSLIRVKNVVGVMSAVSASVSAINGIWRVISVTSTTIEVQQDTAGTFTAWSSGGTVERACFGLRPEQVTGSYVSWVKHFERLTFRGNYADIFLGYCLYTNFLDVVCVGTTTYSVYASNQDCEYVTFTGFFARTGILTGPWAVRGLKFENAVFDLNNWQEPVYTSQGINEGLGNANGEIAKTKFINCFILRNYDASSVPLFKHNNTDNVFDGISVVETGSTNWKVFDDTGSVNTKITNCSVESANAWDWFTSTPSYGAAGGFSTIIDNCNHFQGTVGSMTLSSAKYSGKNTALITVRNTDCNISINAVNASADRGYLFENVSGNIDLTNSSVGGSVLINCYGTVTDPNVAVSIHIDPHNGVLSINPAATYANNAAALSAGLPAGRLYKTAATGTATLNVVNAT